MRSNSTNASPINPDGPRSAFDRYEISPDVVAIKGLLMHGSVDAFLNYLKIERQASVHTVRSYER